MQKPKINKIEKTTLKRYVGGNPCCGQPGEWVNIFLETDSDITRIGDDIKITNPVGMYTYGDVIKNTDNVFNVIHNLVSKHVIPEYIAPTVQVTVVDGPAPGSYPPGTKLHATVRVEATQNDAGELILIKLTMNGREIARTDAALVMETELTWDLNEPVALEASYQYADGPIKNDSFDKPWPDGRILAGEVKATAECGGASYTVEKYVFYGSVPVVFEDIDIAPTEDEIKKLSHKDIDINTSEPMNITLTEGNNRFIFALPKSAGTVTSILYREAGFQELIDIFHQVDMPIHVSDIDPEIVDEYTVYYYTWRQPMIGDLKLIISFN